MWGELKPIISAVVLPPASPLLLIALGAGLYARRRWVGLAKMSIVSGLVLAWLFSTQGMALWLSRHALGAPEPSPALLQQPAAAFKPTPQAVVVLGGGLDSQATEWPDHNTLKPLALARLAYGVNLAQHWHLPLAFSGGMGWAASESQNTSEAQVAARIAQSWGYPMRWLENASRDTAENAHLTAQLLRAQGVESIALVTHAWHMPRAALAFERAGLHILAAPMGGITADQSQWLLWLPSGSGALNCRAVLHEILGQLVAQSQHLFAH